MKLIDYPEKELWRGTVLRFEGKYPFENIVDFMLICYPHSESGFAFICISGYCAGNLEIILPKESKSLSGNSISTQWLIENWNTYIYADCKNENVYLLEAKIPTSFE